MFQLGLYQVAEDWAELVSVRSVYSETERTATQMCANMKDWRL